MQLNQFKKTFWRFDWSFSSWRCQITFRPQLLFHIWYMYHDSDTLLVDTLYSTHHSGSFLGLYLILKIAQAVAEAYIDTSVAKNY
jgi:hypothetical protein